MSLHLRIGLVSAAAVLWASAGCVVLWDDNGHGVGQGGAAPQAPACDPDSSEPVGSNAYQAWKLRPTNVPVVTEEQLLQTCLLAGACSPEVRGMTLEDRMALVDLCLSDVVFSAERAIPLSSWQNDNERAEYFVDCVLSHQDDCAAVEACRTGRDPIISCQEDGCAVDLPVTVECAGSVATLQVDGNVVVRDCSRAYAECDPASATGCTDRPFTRCPDEPPLPDRCDGDIRLGCDGSCQVSYHDCSRMGGTCGTTAEGLQGCVYPEPPSPECTAAAPAAAACSGDLLSACVNGIRLSQTSPLCQAG